MSTGLPILDAHIHLDPDGSPREAVRRFLSQGGTHLVVVHKPYRDIPVSSVDDYRKSFQRTVRMTELARNEGAGAWCVVGPYPVELHRLAEVVGIGEAVRIQMGAIDVALGMVDEGLAAGLGEIGRVHYPVDEGIQAACDRVLLHALRGARELDSFAVIHAESLSSNPDLMGHLGSLADEAGIRRCRVIRHYSDGGATDPDVNLGISVSVTASRSNLKEALSSPHDFLLETDYIDDRSRPDVVLPPDMVPKKVRWAYRGGLLDERRHEALMVHFPKRVMGLDTSL